MVSKKFTLLGFVVGICVAAVKADAISPSGINPTSGSMISSSEYSGRACTSGAYLTGTYEGPVVVGDYVVTWNELTDMNGGTLIVNQCGARVEKVDGKMFTLNRRLNGGHAYMTDSKGMEKSYFYERRVGSVGFFKVR